MWKWIGAVLLLSGGLYLGLSLAGETRRRIRALEAWDNALALLAGELSFRLPDMAQLLEILATRTIPPARDTFFRAGIGLENLGEQSFQDIWAKAVTGGGGGGLAPEDMAPIVSLGSFRGRCGGEEQRSAVETVRQTLTLRASQLRPELGRQGRVYGTLGLSLAGLLVILLL